MVVLIDTNILLDYILCRPVFEKYATHIVNLCMSGNVTGYIAFHSVTNIFYILRKTLSVDDRKIAIRSLCDVFTVVSCSHEKVCAVMDDADASDIEDALQIECAKTCNASYIITRDIGDFKKSSVPAISPNDFIELMH